VVTDEGTCTDSAVMTRCRVGYLTTGVVSGRNCIESETRTTVEELLMSSVHL